MSKPAHNPCGTDLERIRRRFILRVDIALWTDQQAGLLRMSPSKFVGTLLEWARDEDFANDEMLFQAAPLSHPRKPVSGEAPCQTTVAPAAVPVMG
jgi:hypothetical protein